MLAALTFVGGAAAAGSWEDAILAFERADREAPPEPGAVVFTGSSSIRMWQTLALDMAPHRAINRGFGGSQIADVNHYVSRIVLPYQPRAVVLYAGDNDVAAGKPAKQVLADFERFVSLLREGGSRAPILFVAIKPSRLRFGQWPTMAEANAAVAEHCAGDPLLHYVDIATPMLADAKAGGPPPPELFIDDGLHLSAAGYALWTRLVRDALGKALESATAD